MTARLMTLGGQGRFSPFSLGWLMAVWADDPGWAHPADGATVDSWRNGGSLAFTPEQIDVARKPLYRSTVAALNGKAAVDFDGVDDMLASGIITTRAQPFTGIWIGKLDDTPDPDVGERLVDFASDDANVYTSMLAYSGKFQVYASGFAASTVDATSGLAAANRSYFNGGSSAINVNGVNTAVTIGAGPVTRFALGGREGSAPDASNNHTAFAALYPGDVTAHANWPQFVAWVADFYGLTIA